MVNNLISNLIVKQHDKGFDVTFCNATREIIPAYNFLAVTNPLVNDDLGLLTNPVKKSAFINHSGLKLCMIIS